MVEYEQRASRVSGGSFDHKEWIPMSKSAANDTPLQSTKQMLDELDSLMERMLSLPVNELDDLTNAKETPKGPSLAESLTLLGTPPAPSPTPAEPKQERASSATPPKKAP